MIAGRRLLLVISAALVVGGVWQLIPNQHENDAENLSYDTNVMANVTVEPYPRASPAPLARAPNFIGWATLLLGLLGLASNHYLKLRELRRQERELALRYPDEGGKAANTRPAD